MIRTGASLGSTALVFAEDGLGFIESSVFTVTAVDFSGNESQPSAEMLLRVPEDCLPLEGGGIVADRRRRLPAGCPGRRLRL